MANNISFSFKGGPLEQNTVFQRKVRLHNGDIVTITDNDGRVDAYIVTSFRFKDRPNNRNTTKYCTLVDLETGFFATEDPVSRDTTVARVLRHLFIGVSLEMPNILFYDNNVSKGSLDKIAELTHEAIVTVIPKEDFSIEVTAKDKISKYIV